MATWISRRRNKVHKLGIAKGNSFTFPKKANHRRALQSCPRARLKNDRFYMCFFWSGSFPDSPCIFSGYIECILRGWYGGCVGVGGNLSTIFLTCKISKLKGRLDDTLTQPDDREENKEERMICKC